MPRPWQLDAANRDYSTPLAAACQRVSHSCYSPQRRVRIAIYTHVLSPAVIMLPSQSDLTMVELLLEHGANPAASPQRGRVSMPLLAAVRERHLGIVRALSESSRREY